MTILGRREDLAMKPGRTYCKSCDADKMPTFGWLGEGHLSMRIWDECSPNLSFTEVLPFIDGRPCFRTLEVMAGRKGWAIVCVGSCDACRGDRLLKIIYGDVRVELATSRKDIAA